MSYKDDASEYLQCDVSADSERVAEGVRRAIAVLGKHATTVSENRDEIVVGILPGAIQMLSDRSPMVRIQLRYANGKTMVTAEITGYLTSQSKFLYLIPVSPKRLVGRSHFRRLLDALEAEAVAVDPRARPVRRFARLEARASHEV